MKWHLSITNWREDDEEILSTIDDFDLVILVLRAWGYRTIFQWSFQPVCNWLWQWEAQVFSPRPVNELIRINHKLPSLDFLIIIHKVET